MCLLALFFRAVDDAARLSLHNREEYYSRGGSLPDCCPDNRELSPVSTRWRAAPGSALTNTAS